MPVVVKVPFFDFYLKVHSAPRSSAISAMPKRGGYLSTSTHPRRRFHDVGSVSHDSTIKTSKPRHPSQRTTCPSHSPASGASSPFAINGHTGTSSSHIPDTPRPRLYSDSRPPRLLVHQRWRALEFPLALSGSSYGVDHYWITSRVQASAGGG